VTIELQLPGEIWVHTDSALIHRLIGNLMGNAVSHSPRGTTITVALSPKAEITLVNPAPHLTAADVPRLGERFFHVDTGERGVHAGLGLSLACAIAKVLGLQFNLALRRDGCLVATVGGFPPLTGAA
jgi:signal transduction histidine kinase